jgi:hypothetical protein
MTVLSVRLLAAVVAFGAMSAGVSADAARPPANARAGFDKLRTLAGTWTFTIGTERGHVSYELVSDGTAILERVMNGEHGEAGVVSIIHLDGDRLILQHYCSAGNQPQLVSDGLEGDEIRFTLERISNLSSPAAGHIHGATFRFPAGRAFESDWTWREAGTDRTSVRQHSRSRHVRSN